MVEQLAKKMVLWVKHQMQNITHYRTINQMREGKSYVVLSSEQESQVQNFYKQYYGKKINLKWHEYYLFVNNEFSERYIPTYIYYSEIASKLNDSKMSFAYSDKNMIKQYVGNIITLPKTYVQNRNGIYYVEDNIVSKETAMQACLNIPDAVIKHSLDSSQGKSILRFKSENGTVSGPGCPSSIESLFDLYGKNFIVQAAIQQCACLSQLNKSSLNTVRIMTYWSKSGIVPVFAVIRIGRSGAVVDNASAGGIYCGVNINDGSLKEYAYTLHPFSAHTHTDSGVCLKDFVVPKFDLMKAKAIEMHKQLPYAKLIGWDLTINIKDEVELVEINARGPGLFQAATGPAFGKFTEEILEVARRV